ATAVDFSVDNFAEKPAGFFSCTPGGFGCRRSCRTRWGMSTADPQRSPQGAHKLAGRPSPGCPQDRVGRRWRAPPGCKSPLVRRCLTKGLQACNLRGRWRPVSLAEVTQRGEEFERMPPHDVAAEQCVLGGMLLSKDAISDVIEVIRPVDHYRPAHQLV